MMVLVRFHDLQPAFFNCSRTTRFVLLLMPFAAASAAACAAGLLLLLLQLLLLLHSAVVAEGGGWVGVHFCEGLLGIARMSDMF